MQADIIFVQTTYNVDGGEIALKSTDITILFPTKVVADVKMDDHPYHKRDIRLPYDEFIIKSDMAIINGNRYFIDTRQLTRHQGSLIVSLIFDPIGSLLNEGDTLTAEMFIVPTFTSRYVNPITIPYPSYSEVRQIPLQGIPGFNNSGGGASWTETVFWVEITATKDLSGPITNKITTYGAFCPVRDENATAQPFNSSVYFDAAGTKFYLSFQQLMSQLQTLSSLQSTEIISVTASRFCPYPYTVAGQRYRLNGMSETGDYLNWNGGGAADSYVVELTKNDSPQQSNVYQQTFTLDDTERACGSFMLAGAMNEQLINISNPDKPLYAQTMSDVTGMVERFYTLDNSGRQIDIGSRPAITVPWISNNWVNYSSSGRLDYDRQLIQANAEYMKTQQDADLISSSITNVAGAGLLGGLVAGPVGFAAGAGAGLIAGLVGVMGTMVSSEMEIDATQVLANKTQEMMNMVQLRAPSQLVIAASSSKLLLEGWNGTHLSIYMPDSAISSSGTVDYTKINDYLSRKGYNNIPSTSWTVAKGPVKGMINGGNWNRVERAGLNMALNTGLILR